MVGTSGSAGERCGEVTAIARRLPALTCVDRGGQVVEHERDLAADEVVHGRRRSPVGHVDDSTPVIA